MSTENGQTPVTSGLRLGFRTAPRADRLARVLTHVGGGWHVQPVDGEGREFALHPPAGQALVPADAWRLTRELLKLPISLAYAEPELALTELQSGGSSAPLAETADHEWALKLCRFKSAHDKGISGKGVFVGHPDTGYTNHPELPALRLNPGLGYDYVAKDPDARDPLSGLQGGHGTSTGSVLVSPKGGPNTPFVSGAAPGATLVPYRVGGIVVHIGFGELTDAVHRAWKTGVDVLSMSLGGPFPSWSLYSALKKAISKGIVPIAASGNYVPAVIYPARYDIVVAMAAVDALSRPWSDASDGPDVDASAPGVSVWRAEAKPGRFSVSRSDGTSYATALTAGAAALWIENSKIAPTPNRAASFRSRLMGTARRPAGFPTNRFGSGILDVERLLGLDDLEGVVELPEVPAARGLDALEDLIRLFPADVAPEVVRPLSGRAPRQIQSLAQEAILQLGLNPDLYERVKGSEAPGGDVEVYAESASPALRGWLDPLAGL